MENQSMTFSPIRVLSLREQVVEQVRAAIIEGRMKPKDHITELSLTEQMGVSRTPVREALILLEREGLVEFHPNRGYFVRAFKEQDVQEIFSMRTTLENFAAELNITRLGELDYNHLEALIDRQRRATEEKDFKSVRTIDMSFHSYLINFSGHSLLIRSWTELVAQVAALLHIRAGVLEHDETQATRDHQRIVEAYRSQNIQTLVEYNVSINERVSAECQQALHLLKARVSQVKALHQ